jgi:tRNA threonylcarbamoyladenosine biosynthesis protein TsaB
MLDPVASSFNRGSPVTLAFDTAGSACSVAIGRGAAVLAQERREMRHGHAEALLPMIDRIMDPASLAPPDLDVIAVSVGPGGFTGIRAGLAAAHGLALAARAQLIGVTSLAAVAALVRHEEAALLVALDSRRIDLYVQLFDPGGEPRSDPTAILPKALAAFVAVLIGAAPLLVAGDAAEPAGAALSGRAGVEIIAGSAPDALGVLAVAAHRLPFGAAEDTARPLYLRSPDVSFPKSHGASALGAD